MKRLLNENGCLVGKLVKERRDELNVSRKELAALTGLSEGAISKIENEEPRRRDPETVESIHKALKVPLPSKKFTEVAQDLIREPELWSYHLTRNDQFLTAVKVCKWEIAAEGYCKVTQIYEENTSRPNVLKAITPELLYEGEGDVEGDDRLIFTLDARSIKIEERAVWRFPFVPLTSVPEVLEGHWFGIDHHKQTLLGSAILSKCPLHITSPEGQEVRLPADLKKKLNEIKDVTAHLPRNDADQVTVLPEWREHLIHDAIKNCPDGETIDILSTFLSETMRLTSWINVLSRSNRTAPITMRILFLDYHDKAMINARCLIRKKHEHKNFVKAIHDDARDFVHLELGPSVKLQVRFFRTWPFAHCFRIGHEAIYWGILWADKSALNGPMFVLRDSQSSAWKSFRTAFDAIWNDDEASWDARKVIDGDSKKPPLH